MSEKNLSKLLKAVYAGVVTFLGQLTTVLVGQTTIEQVTQGQWSNIALWTVVAAGGVFGLAGWSGPHLNNSSGSKG